MAERGREQDDTMRGHLLYIRDAVDMVNERLDTLNGRTRANEIDIAVLKDRSNDAKKHGGVAGAIGGILAGFMAGWIK